MLDDLRHAFRRLRQRPGFTLVAVSTLALGLGANLAIFTLVYAVAYQPRPVRAPHELVRLGDDDNCCVNSGLQEWHSLFSSQAVDHLRSRLPKLSSVTAFQANPIGAWPFDRGARSVAGRRRRRRDNSVERVWRASDTADVSVVRLRCTLVWRFMSARGLVRSSR